MGDSDRHEQVELSQTQSATASRSSEHMAVHPGTSDAPAESHSFVRHPLVRLLSPSLDPTASLPDVGIDRHARVRDTLYRRALALADIAAAAIALFVPIVVLGGDAVKPWLIAAIPLVVVVGKVIGLYDRDEHVIRKTTLEEAPALFQVATLYTLLIWLGENAFVKETVTAANIGPLGRMQVLGLWASLFISMLVARATVRGVIGRAIPPERCLVLGGRELTAQVSRKFNSVASVGAVVIGRVALEGDDRNGDGPSVLGQFSQLEDLIRSHKVDRVIIAPSKSDSEQLLDAIRLVKALGVKVSVLPRLFEVVGSSVRFDDVDGLVLLGVPHWGLSKSSRLVKRGLDVVGAVVGLVSFAPLLAAIAAAVKVTSAGPVFFRQPRIGRDGEEFQMIKFRTMYRGADAQKSELLELNEADGLFKIANDPRLTRVGRVLRRFSFDELPQLFNVLTGDMSLVGPRPLVTADDERIEGWHRRRLDVPPGMTGIWQVLGSSRIPLQDMVKIDYLYGANWSLWLDLKILLRTVPHVLGRRGL